MKRLTSKLVTLALALMAFISCSGNKNDGNTDTVVCGGYSDLRLPTEEETTLFNQLFKDSAYVIKPVNVISQEVVLKVEPARSAGMNYRFQCEQMNADSTWSSVEVRVYAPLPEEGAPEIRYMEKVADADETGYIVRVGDEAPDFTITTTEGNTVRLSDLRGKVVMLQFTASWCVVCRREMPFIESDIWQKHKDDPNFVLMGVDRDEPLETVIGFKEKMAVTYPLGLDPGASIYSRYALKESGITRNVLIDKNGKIVKMTRLYNQEEFSSLVAMIDSMLQ